MTREDYLHTLRITDDRWDDQPLSVQAERLAAHDAGQRQVIEQLTKTNVYLGETIEKWEKICQGYTVEIEQKAKEIERLERAYTQTVAKRDIIINTLREALAEILDLSKPAYEKALDPFRWIGATREIAQRVLEETKP